MSTKLYEAECYACRQRFAEYDDGKLNKVLRQHFMQTEGDKERHMMLHIAVALARVK